MLYLHETGRIPTKKDIRTKDMKYMKMVVAKAVLTNEEPNTFPYSQKKIIPARKRRHQLQMKYNEEGQGEKASRCDETEMLRRKTGVHTRRQVYGRGTAFQNMRKCKIIKQCEKRQEEGEMSMKKSEAIKEVKEKTKYWTWLNEKM